MGRGGHGDQGFRGAPPPQWLRGAITAPRLLAAPGLGDLGLQGQFPPFRRGPRLHRPRRLPTGLCEPGSLSPCRSDARAACPGLGGLEPGREVKPREPGSGHLSPRAACPALPSGRSFLPTSLTSPRELVPRPGTTPACLSPSHSAACPGPCSPGPVRGTNRHPHPSQSGALPQADRLPGAQS